MDDDSNSLASPPGSLDIRSRSQRFRSGMQSRPPIVTEQKNEREKEADGLINMKHCEEAVGNQ